MNSLFSPFFRAVSQLDDPAFLLVLLQSLLLSGACFALLGLGLSWEMWRLLPHGWVWIAGPLGGLAAWLIALWVFMPLAVVIASLLMEPVARAVERRFYPGLPPARGASIAEQIADGLALGGRLLVLNAFALLLALLLPGPGWLLGWAIAAWGIGRGLFTAVAMRRASRFDAMLRYQQARGTIMAQGALLAVMAGVPLLNLLVPVLGAAMMIHVLELRTSR